MPSDASGERVSKYELIRPLGVGGMGEVYLAHDTVLERQVAIKFVSPARLEDPEATQRLLREARAAATLDHPNICPIYDVHVDPHGRPCIVMQYVEGETLAQRIVRGPLDARVALEIAVGIADALAVAHAHGVVHRDLKPQNVMLAADDRPKLVDFGIAQMELSPEALADIVTHTDSGGWSPAVMMGTPAYMSPEQVLSKPVDARSDLFSLGAVVFECLTGTAAFQAGTDVDTWARVVYVTPPAPSSLNSRVPHDLDAVVARLLAKDPDARYATATDAARALRQVAADVARRPGTGTPSTATRTGMVAAAVAAVAVTAAGGWWFTRPRVAAPTPKAAEWYDLGTHHLRNGAYYSARNALDQAVRQYDAYPQAWARLSEAQSELDDERGALASLLRVTDLQKTTALRKDDATRISAIGAFVRRDLASALTQYQRIADDNPSDPGAWLDLGRVREAAGHRAEAWAAYERALTVQPQNAAAHLRLGEIAAAELRKDKALAEFAEAERLYALASDYEGRTETLLQRAGFLNAIRDIDGARTDLSSAAALAEGQKNRFQQIRARLLLSSVIASDGNLGEAASTAEDAAAAAVQYGLDTLSAEGLIEIGTARLQLGDRDIGGVQLQLERGIERAKQQGALRVAARGTLQLGGLFLKNQQPRDAANVVEGVLPFLRDGHFRRYELVALSILSRAHEDLGEYRQARTLAEQVLSVAEELNDASEVALALEPLAGLATASGSFPEALRVRARLEKIHRDQQDRSALAFDLVNRADLLIRLGRLDDAESPLAEVDAGIAARVDAFVGRRRRALLLRAMADTIRLQFADAEARCAGVLAASKSPDADTTSRLASVLLAHARARLKRPPDARDAIVPRDGAGSPAFLAEMRYWRAATWLARGRDREALDEVTAGLAAMARVPSAEAEWRLAALGAAAARQLNDNSRAGELAARADAALKRLRDDWKTDADEYDRRPDLIERRRAAGLS